MMQHAPRLHEAARAIYEAFYRSDEWAQFAFSEAERYGTAHHHQAVDAEGANKGCPGIRSRAICFTYAMANQPTFLGLRRLASFPGTAAF